jgi:four helix bundle protein
MDQDPDGYKRGKSPLHTKSYLFAVRIIKMYQYLVENKRCYDIAHQVVRSGTSIGATVREAEFAQSPQDFVHKLSISLKEANETDYWLHLLSDTGFIDGKMFESMSSDCNELIAILISSIKTSKQRYNK